MTSRIDKLVREFTGVDRIADAAALRAKPVTLVVSSATQIALARSTVALALRSFGDTVHIHADGPTPAVVVDAMFAEAVEYGGENRLSLKPCDGPLSLGLGCPSGGLLVDASGSVAGINTLLAARPATGPASCFASAAGIAKLFSLAMGVPAELVRESWRMSLATFETQDKNAYLGDIDIGRVLAIGAGAIGAGLAETARYSRWRGHIEFVDRERYDEPNHETTLVISRRHALERCKKAETLGALLNRAELTAHGTLDEINGESSLLQQNWNAVVVGVDNPDLRRALDNVAWPILNAGVGGTRRDAGHVLFSRHTKSDTLLSSLYRATLTATSPDSAPSDITDQCSRIAYAEVALAAPFLGLAAGAILGAGLEHLATGRELSTNYLKFDLLGLQQRFLREKRARSSSAAA